MNYWTLFCIAISALIVSHGIEAPSAKNYREEALKQAIAERDQWVKKTGARYTNATETASLDGRRFKLCPICKWDGKETGGGIIVCFGCREVYWKEPIGCVWHVKFCPYCAKDTDPRWNKDDVELWEHFKLIFQRDFRETRWIAGAGTGK